MARQKTETVINMEDANTPGLPSMVSALDQEVITTHESNENANIVAKQLGYDGLMTVGAIEDEIRLYQRRTAEASLELGKRLLILKELSVQGEFIQRCELLGFNKRTAQRFMQAAFKFSKSDNLSLLAKKIGSQTKLLELVTMDDDEIEQLSNGETIRGLSLDAIETMTATELKAKLREVEANYEAQGKVLEDKSSLNDKLLTQINARERLGTQKSPDEIAKELRNQATTDAFRAEHTIANELGATFKSLIEHSLDNGGDHQQFMLGLVTQIELELIKVRQEFNLQGNVTTDQTPDWMKPEADEAVKKAEAEWAERLASPEFANHPAAKAVN